MRNVREEPNNPDEFAVLNFHTYGHGEEFQFVIDADDVDRIGKILSIESPEYSRRTMTFDDVRGLAVIIDLGNVTATKVEPFTSWDDIPIDDRIETIANDTGPNFAVFLDTPKAVVTGHIPVTVNEEGVDQVTALFEGLESMELSIDEDDDPEQMIPITMTFKTSDGGVIYVVPQSVVAVLVNTYDAHEGNISTVAS